MRMGAEDENRGLLSAYENSLNTSDAALAASCYTGDGVFMPTTAPTVAGAAMEGAYRQRFDTIRLDLSFTVDELRRSRLCNHAEQRHSNCARQRRSDRGIQP
jgi:ketosteroid isomerase-like protein